jgi:menaquinol-cytochrome c reductase iron-sulfur subunit
LQSDNAERVEEEDSPSRRKFLSVASGVLLTITTAGIAGPLVGMFLAPLFQRHKELWLSLGPEKEVPKEEPQKFVFRYVRTDGWYEKTVYGTAYAVREGREIAVLSNICTHLGCGVRWDPDRNAFVCPCHNGVFNRDGKVISGPPPKPLRRFVSKVADGEIHIRVEEA